MCGDEDRAVAVTWTRLQAMKPLNETYSLTALPEGESQVILGSEDRTRSVPTLREFATSRLGVNAEVIESDYSPFFSAPSRLVLLMTSRDGATRTLRP